MFKTFLLEVITLLPKLKVSQHINLLRLNPECQPDWLDVLVQHVIGCCAEGAGHVS